MTFALLLWLIFPGLSKEAAQGKGLGTYFLRHIERNAVLLYLIPADANDIKKEFSILRKELQEFNPELLDKKYVIALSKCDLLDEELKAEYAQEMKEQFGETSPHLMTSSVSQLGLMGLKDLLWGLNRRKNP